MIFEYISFNPVCSFHRYQGSTDRQGIMVPSESVHLVLDRVVPSFLKIFPIQHQQTLVHRSLIKMVRSTMVQNAGLFWKVYIFSNRSYDHSKSNLEWHYWIKLSIFFRIWKISVRVYSCFFALEFGSVWTLKIQPLCVSSTSAFFTSQRLKKTLKMVSTQQICRF